MDLRGNVIHVHYKWQVIPGHEEDFRRVVGMAIDVTERKKLEELMAYQVAHDALTGLLNRAAFLRELEGLFAEKRHRQKKFVLHRSQRL
jgi:PleD family two-component response regulator